MPGYDPRLGTLDEQPYGWAGIADARVSELYDSGSQFSDYGMITLDRDVGGSNRTGFFRLRPTRNDTSRDWLQARGKPNAPGRLCETVAKQFFEVRWWTKARPRSCSRNPILAGTNVW